MMDGNARTLALVEFMKRSKESPMMNGDAMGGGGDFMKKAPMHCKMGLKMARGFLDGEEGATSPLRSKVEALANAYEDLMSSMGEGNNGEEDYEGY